MDNINILRPSSIPDQYYFGDLPGTLQYSLDPEDLKQIPLPVIKEMNSYSSNFSLCEHSLENLHRLVPRSQRHVHWKIILMMKEYREEDHEIWLKGALLNQSTGKIALLTSTNHPENIRKKGSRTVKTLDGKWYVGHYRMSAPIYFWKELKNRLLY